VETEVNSDTPKPGVYLQFLRDRIAVKAMEGLMPVMIENAQTPNEIAVKAYELADAMLRAREVK
jgi:hypothetical protein